MALPNFSTQVLGFGPAAIGLAVAADRMGQLAAWLESGVAFIDKAPLDAWENLNYDIEANSSSCDLIANVARDGIFAGCHETPEARALRQAGRSRLSLVVAHGFMRQLRDRLCAKVAEYPAASILTGRTVGWIQQDARGRYVTFDAEGRGIAVSDKVVLALGADCASPALDRTAAISCEQVLRGWRDPILAATIAEGGVIVIRGGAHSAFSTAEYLLRKWGAGLRPGQVTVVHKHGVIEWYASAEECARDCTEPNDQLVSPQTGERNRFTGLRGVARDLHRAIRAGEVPQVRLVAAGSAQADAALDAARVLIEATGYQPRMVPIIGADGGLVAVDVEGNNVLKDSQTRAILSGGKPLPGIFGLGLGYADRGADGFQVGINFFHGECAAAIVGQVTDDQRQPLAVSA